MSEESADHELSAAFIEVEAGAALARPSGEHAAHRSREAVFAPGQVVASRYRIEQRIGRGGMGEVYSALDQEFGERVALKTICPSIASDPNIVARFKQELKLARSISHPSVCRVLEFGRHELAGGASQCFFTLAFIEGITLRQRLLAGTPVELNDAITLLEALARGLDAIHAQSVVHRDIKPENVMLPADQGDVAAIWVDFGLARDDLGESRSGGAWAGTPDYSAPEVLRGGVASRASDLYAFGLVMFELLTGALPFPRSKSFSTASQRGSVQVPAPGARRAEIPPELDALVLDCLEEDPESRPPSAAYVAERLHAIAINLYLRPHSHISRIPPAKRSTTWKLNVPLAFMVALVLSSAVLVLYRYNARSQSAFSRTSDSTAPANATLRSALPALESASSTLPSPTSALSAPSLPPATHASALVAERAGSPERRTTQRQQPPSTASASPASVSPAPAPPATRTLPNFGGRH